MKTKRNERNQLLEHSQAVLGAAQTSPSGCPWPSSLRPGHVTPPPTSRLQSLRDLGQSLGTHLSLNPELNRE